MTGVRRSTGDVPPLVAVVHPTISRVPLRAAENRSSPSSTMTMGMELWALKIATSFTASAAAGPLSPAAHTNAIGSLERSMCFLSSIVSTDTDL